MTQVGDVMQAILDRVEERLTTPVGLASLTPGMETAWDDCCSGQLWVRLLTMVPIFDQTAQRGAGAYSGLVGWSVDVAVGAIRCVTGLNEDGDPPTADQMTADTLAEIQDMVDIRDALICAVPGIPNLARPTLLSWLPQGALGNCAGGEWQFRFQMPYCGC